MPQPNLISFPASSFTMEGKEEKKLDDPSLTARPKKQMDTSACSLVLKCFQCETKQVQCTFNTQMKTF